MFKYLWFHLPIAQVFLDQLKTVTRQLLLRRLHGAALAQSAFYQKHKNYNPRSKGKLVLAIK
jgi:hypothetical protein